jgi:hypothetical protein
MTKDSGRGVNKDMNEKKRGKRLVKFVADVCTFIKARFVMTRFEGT